MIISISAEELALDSKHNAKAVIIDVREADEFAAAHVANASNFPLSELIKNHPNIAKNTELLIYCDKGFRSMIAASVLKVMGFSNIKNVWGGFDQIVHQTVALKP
jgi:rhodanese-related sulfurtransferase